MTVKENPVTIVFKHQGQVIEALVLANKGICWQVELSDGSTTLVQKKHVISEGTQPPEEFHTDSSVTDDPFDEPPAADSLASMLTKIRSEGKVTTTPKRSPKAPKQPATPAAKPATDSSIITLKALCAELNIEPRIARRRLRNSQGQVGTGSRWEWEAGSKELAAIRTAIKG